MVLLLIHTYILTLEGFLLVWGFWLVRAVDYCNSELGEVGGREGGMRDSSL